MHHVTGKKDGLHLVHHEPSPEVVADGAEVVAAFAVERRLGVRRRVPELYFVRAGLQESGGEVDFPFGMPRLAPPDFK